MILDAYSERINETQRKEIFDRIKTIAENESKSEDGSDKNGQMENFSFADSESEELEIEEYKEEIKDENEMDTKDQANEDDQEPIKGKKKKKDKKDKKSKGFKTEKRKKKESRTVNALGLIVLEDTDAKE